MEDESALLRIERGGEQRPSAVEMYSAALVAKIDPGIAIAAQTEAMIQCEIAYGKYENTTLYVFTIVQFSLVSAFPWFCVFSFSVSLSLSVFPAIELCSCCFFISRVLSVLC